METEIIIAGFGGQGVLFFGQILAYAGMDQGFEVTWFPSYGPEMRGGTANCTVVIADEEIGAPIVNHPRVVVAMNLPSLDKYEMSIQAGGTLVINSSLVNRRVTRQDIKVVEIPANELAEKMGDMRMANMFLMGGLLANHPILPTEAVEKALKDHLPERHQHLFTKNCEAIRLGATYLAAALA
jgi:2-oxoglutarate ferredoxin oxidoreductase subunit gamma